ncbi:MAG: hypothetical protein JKY01_07730 [Pseudomonadales bacterium]|nr:hypothetical protein [Pseudomonadales bacterium]
MTFPVFSKCHVSLVKILLFFVAVSNVAFAGDYLIVTNKNNSVDSIPLKGATSIFLGVQRVFVSGYEIEIIDQPVNSDTYSKFYRLVTSKSVAQIRSRRASLTFAGVSFPPEVVENDEEVLRWLEKHTNGIGYIGESSLDDRVKVLLRIPSKIED